MAFVVRTAGDPYALAATMRRAAAELDPSLPLANMKTMDEHIARALARPRFVSTLTAAFGLLALSLAIVGVYGVMAWSVSERRREFAIRVALGVSGTALLGVVMRKGVVLAAIGIVCGIAAARAATAVLTGMLFGVTAADPSVFALTTASIAVVVMAACYLPARRALRVDPATLLR
jgi:ABC-type antimicrobial peptide transport system permease subunit